MKKNGKGLWDAENRPAAYDVGFSSTYEMATLPSTLPMANPSAAGKHATTRVWNLRGDSKDYMCAIDEVQVYQPRTSVAL